MVKLLIGHEVPQKSTSLQASCGCTSVHAIPRGSLTDKSVTQADASVTDLFLCRNNKSCWDSFNACENFSVYHQEIDLGWCNIDFRYIQNLSRDNVSASVAHFDPAIHKCCVIPESDCVLVFNCKAIL